MMMHLSTTSARTSKALRVMQVVLSLAPGGTERLVIEMVRRLRAYGIESVVCCLEDQGAWAGEIVDLSVPVIALHREPGFAPGIARAVSKLIAEYRIDVVHAHHYSPFVYGQMGALFAGGTRVVFTEHGRLSDAPPSAKRRLINLLLGRIPAAIYAVSHDLRRHMVDEGLPASRVQVRHNGIDPGPPVTTETRRLARAMLGIGPDELIVGTVARLDPVKDLATLIDGFDVVRNQSRHARLVIVGDGPERAPLVKHVAERELSDAVVFTGHRQDVRALLPAFDIYANSSIHEGVSLTILEAMAAALPVVATGAGGNPEVVDAATGVLVPCRNAAALGDALLELGANPLRRLRMSTAARARVESAFSIHGMLSEYLTTYHGITHRRAAPKTDVPVRS